MNTGFSKLFTCYLSSSWFFSVLYARGWLFSSSFFLCKFVISMSPASRAKSSKCWGDHRSHHTGSAEGKSRCLWRWCWPIRGRAAADWWDPFEAPQSRDFPLNIWWKSRRDVISKQTRTFWFLFSSLPDLRKKDETRHTFFQNHFGGRPCRGKRRAKSSCCFFVSSSKCTAGLA